MILIRSNLCPDFKMFEKHICLFQSLMPQATIGFLSSDVLIGS
uniref:Uncharacterized protein n=1 Tax=Arundo donax TaxID=35708 RepID=A0A0A8ZBZ1_ARUDO